MAAPPYLITTVFPANRWRYGRASERTDTLSKDEKFLPCTVTIRCSQASEIDLHRHHDAKICSSEAFATVLRKSMRHDNHQRPLGLHRCCLANVHRSCCCNVQIG